MSENKFLPFGVDGNGVKEDVAFDWDKGEMIWRYTFDTAPENAILERNKQFDSYTDGYTPSRDLQHVASIPMSVIALWIQRYGVDPTARGNETLLMRLLNDPEWREVRTGPGTVVFKER